MQIELPSLPKVAFDPALLRNSVIDATFEPMMVEGLNQLLKRYSAHQSPRNGVVRLEDAHWVSSWDAALRGIGSANVMFHGSELGVLALLARAQGAKHIFVRESSAFDERLAAGIVQKNLLRQWREHHGVAVQQWTEEERRASFERFSQGIDFISADEQPRCDCFVFPNIDHSLLGTGIVPAIRRFASKFATESARLLPARAAIFAMPVEWTYAASAFHLERINEFRWSFYPQALELGEECWRALADPMQIGEIDFEKFADAIWELQFTLRRQGNVDAIIYWFELDLGTARLSNAPGTALQCIRPAVQYCDPIPVVAEQMLPVRVAISETRLHVEAQPAPRRIRAHQLPSWYLPMLLDRHRNDAYCRAIRRALAPQPAATVLDIGAGCGLLSMMAAGAGATQIVGSELSVPLAQTASDVVRANGFEARIRIVAKDCRKMRVSADMPERADLVIFELFDCSLIGEGVLHFLRDARQHLLQENARYLPRAARIRAALVEYRLDRVLDIDVSLLNAYRHSPAFINVDASALGHRLLTEPVDVFHFDFSTAEPVPEEKELVLSATDDGRVGAVLFWFDLQLDETTWLSNAPSCSQRLHWKQGLQLLPEAIVAKGTCLPIVAMHDGSSLTFHWQQDGLPKEAFSGLPRFDPRWWRYGQELEQQMQGLLRHCMHNPDQYGKVAELAKRFAIDPARYGIDPMMAQRFAAMFFGAYRGN